MGKEMAGMRKEVEELKEEKAALREQVEDLAENMRVGFLRVIELLEKRKKKKKVVEEDKEEDRGEGGSKDRDAMEE